MFKRTPTKSLAAILTLACVAATAQASMITSSGFSATTSMAVDTTGALDWGYFTGPIFSTNPSDAAFSSMTGAVVSPSSAIGAVTVTEGSNGVDPKSTTLVQYSFNGNTAIGGYGNLASGEDNAWSITFNDLGIGNRTITLYLGHSNLSRVFTMDVALDGTTLVTNQESIAGGIGNYDTGSADEHAFRYDITVDSTAPDTDLTLTFGSKTGGTGEAYWAGYTVTVPEPASLALIGLGGLIIANRRRRGLPVA